MIRYLRYAFFACLAIVLLTVALANRGAVGLNLLPADMAAFAGQQYSVTLPLYLVIFGSMVIGLLIGFVWEWFREHKFRATASGRAREIARLEREIADLRRGQPGHKDDVLALLDQPAKTG
jgi:lipopolysaccharide assembly protein A